MTIWILIGICALVLLAGNGNGKAVGGALLIIVSGIIVGYLTQYIGDPIFDYFSLGDTIKPDPNTSKQFVDLEMSIEEAGIKNAITIFILGVFAIAGMIVFKVKGRD